MEDDDQQSTYAVDRRVELSQEWEGLIGEVRELGRARGIPELTDFLRPPRAASLTAAGREGAVVAVNISRLRCDALLITETGVRGLPLPGVTAGGVEDRTVAYLVALRTLERAAWELQAARAPFEQGDRSPEVFFRISDARAALALARRLAEDELGTLTAWLWDEICGPVLDALGHTEAPADGTPPPRVWWCPTGLLNLLPLHAAGHHGEPSDATPRTVLDRVVSSYTPTVRALLTARSRARSGTAADGTGRMLFVAPEPVGMPPLESLAADREALVGRFGERLTRLEGADATADAVLAALHRHPWVHFSSHAGQDLDDPGLGSIALREDGLTVHDLAERSYSGEFAFLSACQTAVGGIDLANETITLSAALHIAGFRHVIGTLWSVYDRAAADVTRDFYGDGAAPGSATPGSTTSGGGPSTVPDFEPADAARHLHRAVRALRDRDRTRLTTWVPFVHIGP
ncbi:CHAT domain-containing protein [Streptomyces sp. NPDC001586]|uniref:CHAT domain-containing protein n=1 Tax=Streptomyces sp. NPDC001586 TaxID=3154387 RepID=UPI00332AA587